jgi:hypothetical protein
VQKSFPEEVLAEIDRAALKEVGRLFLEYLDDDKDKTLEESLNKFSRDLERLKEARLRAKAAAMKTFGMVNQKTGVL